MGTVCGADVMRVPPGRRAVSVGIARSPRARPRRTGIAGATSGVAKARASRHHRGGSIARSRVELAATEEGPTYARRMAALWPKAAMNRWLDWDSEPTGAGRGRPTGGPGRRQRLPTC